MRKTLSGIRPIPERISAKREVVYSTLVAVLGFALGFVAKATDSISILGDIGTHLGIWVLVASLIVAFSSAPVIAMINAPLFFLPMLASYYLYGHFVLGFFPKSYFIGWLIVSLLSPLGGLAVWFSRGNGWVAYICAALPVSFLLAEGYPAFYTYRITLILDLFFAAVLLIVLQKTWRSRAFVLALACILTLVFTSLNLLSFLPF